MTSKEDKNESKYFYIIVIITTLLAGIIVWQLFFVENESFVSPDASMEEVPEVDFVFFDSYAFQSLNEFERGDNPLLPWTQIRNSNPFGVPKVPEDKKIRDWWPIFNIQLVVEGDYWEGKTPRIIEGDENPDIVLFEDRWYKWEWENKNSDYNLQIVNSDDDVLVDSEEDKNEEKLRFQAEKGMNKYVSSEGPEGEIEVIPEDDYEFIKPEDEETEEDVNNLLIKAGSDLSDFYNLIQKDDLDEVKKEEARQTYSTLEDDFQELEELSQSDTKEEEVIDSINDFREEVDEAIETTKSSKNTEESSEEETENSDYSAEHEEMLESYWNDVDSFRDDIEDIDDEEEKEKALETYDYLESELQKIEDKYYSGEINEEELEIELEKFYEEANNLLSELGIYN